MLPNPPKNQSDFIPRRPALRVERGGLYISQERSAVSIATALENVFREAAAGAKRSTNSKAYPGPMIAAMATAVRIPLARRLYALLEQNWKGAGTREFGERIAAAIATCNAQLERKYGRITHRHGKGAA